MNILAVIDYIKIKSLKVIMNKNPHTKSSLNGSISTSLNKKVAEKQKEKDKRTKEKSKSSKRGEHDPDVSFIFFN